MANTDTIIGVLLLLTVFLAGMVFLFDSATHNIQDNQEQARQSFQADRVQTEYSTALRHEPNGTPLWRTISTHFKETSFQNPSFEKREEVRETLNEIYGEKQWYFKAGWDLQNITLSFILDGSNTLQQERQDLKNNLPGLRNQLKSRLGDNASITTNIFLLGDTVSCTNGFNTIGNCVEVQDEMYELNPPYDAPTKPTVNGAFNANYDEDTLIEHDWASGTAYAEYYFREKQNLSQSNIPFLHIIFPVSDEFSTGSVQDKCMTDSDVVYSYVCALCEDSCSASSSVYQRSNKSVENAVDVLNGTESVVNPVYSFAADTNISNLNEPPFSTNTKANNEYGSPGGGNWCENASQCNGCTGRSPDIAFRNTTTCKTGVKTHMERLANTTGGEILSLQDDSLSDTVESTVNNVLSTNPFRIELGEPKGGTRFVAQRDIPIFGSQVAQASLYAYQKPTNTSLTIQDVDVHPSIVSPGNNMTAVLRSPAAQPLDVSVSQNGSSENLRHIAGNVYAAKTNLSSGQYTSTFTAVTTDQRESRSIPFPHVRNHNLPNLEDKDVVSQKNVSPAETFNINANTTKPIDRAYATILGPEGSETSISLTGTSQIYTENTSLSTYGEHHISITLENNSDTRTYAFVDTVQVKNVTTPCMNESMCSTSNPYCTGSSSSNLTCSDTKAAQGMYASNESSCASGLSLLSNHICTQVNTYDIALAKKSGQTLGYSLNQIENRLLSVTPIQECSPLNESLFNITQVNLPSSDVPSCDGEIETYMTESEKNQSIQSIANEMDECTSEAVTAVQNHPRFSSTTVDRVSMFTGKRWLALNQTACQNPSIPCTGGELFGKALGIPSLGSVSTMNSSSYVSQADATGTAAHEAGHTWGLYHLDCGGTSGACQGPNSADCSPPSPQPYVMDYCQPYNEYGPAGYNVIKNKISLQLRACN